MSEIGLSSAAQVVGVSRQRRASRCTKAGYVLVLCADVLQNPSISRPHGLQYRKPSPGNKRGNTPDGGKSAGKPALRARDKKWAL